MKNSGDAIIKIPPELFATAETTEYSGTLNIGDLVLGPDTFQFDAPVNWEVTVTNTGSAFLVEGGAIGVAQSQCSRCLEPAVYDFEGEIQGFYLIEGHEPEDFDEAEDELEGDEFEILPTDHCINLEPLIRAALIMDAPDKPLCADDCKGICPVCGRNLNEGPCGCDQSLEAKEFEQAANPFAALANFNFNN